MKYTTKLLSEGMLLQIKETLENISYGSVEIFVQDNMITQITVRNIIKVAAKEKRQDKIYRPINSDHGKTV